MKYIVLILLVSSLEAADHSRFQRHYLAPPNVPCVFFSNDEKPGNAHDLNHLIRFLMRVLPHSPEKLDEASLKRASEEGWKELERLERIQEKKSLQERAALGISPSNREVPDLENKVRQQQRAFEEEVLKSPDVERRVEERRKRLLEVYDLGRKLEEKKNRSLEEEQELERLLEEQREIEDEGTRLQAILDEGLDSRIGERSLVTEFPSLREFLKKREKEIEEYRKLSQYLRKVRNFFDRGREEVSALASAKYSYKQEERLFFSILSRLPRNVRIAVGYEGEDVKTVRFLQVSEGLVPESKFIRFEYKDDERSLGKEMERVFGVKRPNTYRWMKCDGLPAPAEAP